LVQLKADLDDVDDDTIRYELYEIRTELKAVDSMVAGSESPEGFATAQRRWCCTFCGNVVALQERPTECYHCRRGESELQLNESRLFVELDEQP
jgi:rubrerythrin